MLNQSTLSTLWSFFSKAAPTTATTPKSTAPNLQWLAAHAGSPNNSAPTGPSQPPLESRTGSQTWNDWLTYPAKTVRDRTRQYVEPTLAEWTHTAKSGVQDLGTMLSLAWTGGKGWLSEKAQDVCGRARSAWDTATGAVSGEWSEIPRDEDPSSDQEWFDASDGAEQDEDLTKLTKKLDVEDDTPPVFDRSSGWPAINETLTSGRPWAHLKFTPLLY